MKFEWDEEKNNINLIKHGITFKEAETVFDDENAIVIYDEDHSADEERFIIIGIDLHYRELTVCHCCRGNDDDIIRLISARKATRIESDLYRRGWV